jgi:hypothetical protein
VGQVADLLAHAFCYTLAVYYARSTILHVHAWAIHCPRCAMICCGDGDVLSCGLLTES